RRERRWAYQPLLTSYGKFRRPTASSGLCRRRFLRGKALCNPETVVGDDLGLPRAEFAGAPSCAEDGTHVAQAVPRNGCNVSFGASDERKPRDGGPAHSRKGLRELAVGLKGRCRCLPFTEPGHFGARFCRHWRVRSPAATGCSPRTDNMP